MQWLCFCCSYIPQARQSLSAARPILKLRRPQRMPALGHGNLGKDAAVAKTVQTTSMALWKIRLLASSCCFRRWGCCACSGDDDDTHCSSGNPPPWVGFVSGGCVELGGVRGWNLF